MKKMILRVVLAALVIAGGLGATNSNLIDSVKEVEPSVLSFELSKEVEPSILSFEFSKEVEPSILSFEFSKEVEPSVLSHKFN